MGAALPADRVHSPTDAHQSYRNGARRFCDGMSGGCRIAPMSKRLALVGGILAAVVSLAPPPGFPTAQEAWPGIQWPQAPPGAPGAADAAFTALDRDLRDGAYGHVDRVLVIHHGRTVADWT